MKEKEYDERCLACRWHRPNETPSCGRLFEVEMFIWPLGGKINVQLTPGLIPDDFAPEVEDMLAKVFKRVADVITAWPGWVDLAELTEERGGCPSREEIPMAKVVKFELRRIK